MSTDTDTPVVEGVYNIDSDSDSNNEQVVVEGVYDFENWQPEEQLTAHAPQTQRARLEHAFPWDSHIFCYDASGNVTDVQKAFKKKRSTRKAICHQAYYFKHHSDDADEQALALKLKAIKPSRLAFLCL